MRGSVFKRCSRCGKVRRDDRRTCPQCGSKVVKWAYRAYVGRDEDGRWREQYRRGFERKADAQRALNELLVTLQDGSFVPRSTRTLGEYLTQEWLPETAPPRVRHETWADRKRNLEQHVVARIGHVRLQELSAAHLNRLYAELLRRSVVEPA